MTTDTLQRRIMLGVNKAEGFANMALRAQDPTEATKHLHASLKEIFFMLEAIGSTSNAKVTM